MTGTVPGRWTRRTGPAAAPCRPGTGGTGRRALFARGAEPVTFDGPEVHGIDSENDTAQAMLQMITARSHD
ncbi:hypothetical protein [Streptomyces sp. PD-S100-1]|uniref:hypothetical protein n=1 Tax=Streptomyces sp. PD-S100-1 TaxID=3394351 RepID=UPI0039BC88C2